MCFPVSHVYFFFGEGAKSIAKLDGGDHSLICSLYPSLPCGVRFHSMSLKKSIYGLSRNQFPFLIIPLHCLNFSEAYLTSSLTINPFQYVASFR